jgi:hypothetical protein
MATITASRHRCHVFAKLPRDFLTSSQRLGVFLRGGFELGDMMEATMIMSEEYLRDRAEDCSRLAQQESDLNMRSMLADLEMDYRAKALHAAAKGWRDPPRYFG